MCQCVRHVCDNVNRYVWHKRCDAKSKWTEKICRLNKRLEYVQYVHLIVWKNCCHCAIYCFMFIEYVYSLTRLLCSFFSFSTILVFLRSFSIAFFHMSRLTHWILSAYAESHVAQQLHFQKNSINKRIFHIWLILHLTHLTFDST